MKACQTALESYAIDNNGFPTMELGGPDNSWGLSKVLTTPVAYIAVIPSDPFLYLQEGGVGRLLRGVFRPERRREVLLSRDAQSVLGEHEGSPASREVGNTVCRGGDRTPISGSAENGFALEVDWPFTYGYDSTNGLISDGNVAFPRY